MMPFVFHKGPSEPVNVLCLGAHSDDIEIGCGATLFELLHCGRKVNVRWVVFSGSTDRAAEARNSAAHWLEDADSKEIVLHDFRDGFFPDDWCRIKTVFEQIKGIFDPDLIFTHYGRDMHQDHRIISELTWNTFRNHTVLEYEIPKFDGDLRTPNVYMPVDAGMAEAKAVALMQFFTSQGDRHWFCKELFLGLMRIRGMECCAPSGFAEGFHARKITLGQAFGSTSS